MFNHFFSRVSSVINDLHFIERFKNGRKEKRNFGIINCQLLVILRAGVLADGMVYSMCYVINHPQSFKVSDDHVYFSFLSLFFSSRFLAIKLAP